MKKSRAWIVSDAAGDLVVFARTRNEALNEIEEPQLPPGADIVVTRAKQFDQYAQAGRVPARALVESGWQVPCRRCGELVSKDDLRVGAEVDDEALCAFCAPEVYEAKEGDS